jgi:hypothetical protein
MVRQRTGKARHLRFALLITSRRPGGVFHGSEKEREKEKRKRVEGSAGRAATYIHTEASRLSLSF